MIYNYTLCGPLSTLSFVFEIKKNDLTSCSIVLLTYVTHNMILFFESCLKIIWQLIIIIIY